MVDWEENIKNIKSNVKKSIKVRNYFIKSYVFTIGIFIFVTWSLVYTEMLYKKQEYKANWEEKKCRAEVLPIAGFINHDYGDDVFEKINKTGINFRSCISTIKGVIMDNLLVPFEGIVDKLMDYNNIFSAIFDTMRKFFNKMIEMISIVIGNLGKLKDFFLGVLNIVLLVIKSILTVFISIISNVYEIIITIYDIFKFFIGYIGKLLNKILIGMWGTVVGFFVLAGVFYGLSLMPIVGLAFLVPAQVFTVIALTTTAVATALTIVSDDTRTFFSQLQHELETPEAKGDCVEWSSDVWEDEDCQGENRNSCFNDDYVEKWHSGLSQKECKDKFGASYTDNFEAVSGSQKYGWLFCFHPDTILTMKNNKKKKISNVKTGELLADGSRITATMKINAQIHTMYNFNDIIITGSHRVKNSQGGWVRVDRHPDSILIGTMPISEVYCLNTDSKIIKIGEYEFMDWDEISDMEMIDLRRVAKDYLPRRPSKRDIHRYMDSGFHGNTRVELDDGRSIKIKDLEINDVLRFGERIIGVVHIDTKNLDCIKEYRYQHFSFIGGPNIALYDEHLGNLLTLNMEGVEIEKRPSQLYHVFTDKGGLIIDGIRFYDYNAAMELFLDEPCVYFKNNMY